MRKARAIIDTPIGKIFTVDFDGTLFFNIKEVCAGIGLRGHSPWSWHAERADNRERFYRRYSMKRRSFTENMNGHGSITMISLEGLYDYLSNPRFKSALTMMFKVWLSNNYPMEQQASQQEQYMKDLFELGPEYADTKIVAQECHPDQISMDEHEQCRDILPPKPKRWRVQYVCPECGHQDTRASKHCPECGERLVV